VLAEPDAKLRLDEYCARVGYTGRREPAATVLRDLHVAHATHIPFENLDISLGRPIRLGLDQVQEKLVRGRRGGYCFEHNTLFAAVLEACGFAVVRLAARVRAGATRVLPRTHMLLEVTAEGRSFLCDVGFGADGPLLPISLAAGTEVAVFNRPYRLAREGDLLVLQWATAGNWQDLYAFTREPQYAIDFEMANHYTSTYPESRFVRTITAQRRLPTEQFVLRNRDLTIERGGTTQTRTIEDASMLGSVLSEHFGLSLTASELDAAFRVACAGSVGNV
jgi:N-hydroxyarylamine O-acetyltransferase